MVIGSQVIPWGDFCAQNEEEEEALKIEKNYGIKWGAIFIP